MNIGDEKKLNEEMGVTRSSNKNICCYGNNFCFISELDKSIAIVYSRYDYFTDLVSWYRNNKLSID